MSPESNEEEKREHFQNVKSRLMRRIERCRTQEELEKFLKKFKTDPKTALKAAVQEDVDNINENIKNLTDSKSKLSSSKSSIDNWDL